MSAALCSTCNRRPALVFRRKTRGRQAGQMKHGAMKQHDECLQCHRATCNRMMPKWKRNTERRMSA